MPMNSASIEERNGGYYVAGTRISLDSVVYSFEPGEHGRILVSHDTSTMPVHFFDQLRFGRSSPGVFLVRQRASVGRVYPLFAFTRPS
jgi:hypothetical protein